MEETAPSVGREAMEAEGPMGSGLDRATAMLCQEPVARRVFQCLSGSPALALPAQLSSAFARRYAFRRLRRLALRIDDNVFDETHDLLLGPELADWPLRRLAIRGSCFRPIPSRAWERLRQGPIAQSLHFLHIDLELSQRRIPKDWIPEGAPLANLRSLDLHPGRFEVDEGALLGFLPRIAGRRLEKLRVRQPRWHLLAQVGLLDQLFALFPSLISLQSYYETNDLQQELWSALSEETRKRLGSSLVALGHSRALNLSQEEGQQFTRIRKLSAPFPHCVQSLESSWASLTTLKTVLCAAWAEGEEADDQGEETERLVNEEMAPLRSLRALRHLWLELGPTMAHLLSRWSQLRELPLTSLRVELLDMVFELPATLPCIQAPPSLRKLSLIVCTEHTLENLSAEERCVGPLLAGGVAYGCLEEVSLSGPPWVLGRLAESAAALPALRWASWRTLVDHSPARFPRLYRRVAKGAFAQEEVGRLGEASAEAWRRLLVAWTEATEAFDRAERRHIAAQHARLHHAAVI